jgi:hypothetical protein
MKQKFGSAFSEASNYTTSSNTKVLNERTASNFNNFELKKFKVDKSGS